MISEIIWKYFSVIGIFLIKNKRIFNLKISASKCRQKLSETINRNYSPIVMHDEITLKFRYIK